MIFFGFFIFFSKFIWNFDIFRGLVYAVGGFNGSLRVRTVDVYDPLRDVWSSAPNMEARRSTLGVAVLNDCIYAVGGFDGSTGLNSAEVLDLSVVSPIMVNTYIVNSTKVMLEKCSSSSR